MESAQDRFDLLLDATRQFLLCHEPDIFRFVCFSDCHVPPVRKEVYDSLYPEFFKLNTESQVEDVRNLIINQS